MQKQTQRYPQQASGSPQSTTKVRLRDPFVEKTITGTTSDYKIVERIGSGGMGVVYRGLKGDTSVAVKFLGNDLGAIDESAVQRLKIEAHSMYQINHPNVVKILDYGVYDTRAFLVMECLTGASLDNWLSKPLPWSTIKDIVLQTCDGLAAAHEKGIIHRDIKPPNIFLLDDPDRVFIKIIDFGTAKVLGDMFTTQTRTGHVVGTLQYMAPEMLEGSPPPAKLLPRVDVYSTGAVLYHLLAGQLPFDRSSIPALTTAIVSEPVVPVSECAPERGIPPDLEELVLTALAKDPYDRFPSILALKEAIASIDWDGVPYSYKRSGVLRFLLTSGVTVAALAGLGLAGWHYQNELRSYYQNTILPAYYNRTVPYLKQYGIPHPELPGYNAIPAPKAATAKSTPAEAPAPKPAPAQVHHVKKHVRHPGRVSPSMAEPDTSSAEVPDSLDASPQATDSSVRGY